jgi:hypothetical protein
MAFRIRRANYYYMTIREEPGQGYRLLHRLGGLGVNLHAFSAVPIGPVRTQFSLFPQDEAVLKKAAQEIGFDLDGPHAALLVQGDDELGALARVHRTLFDAGVNVYASSGVTDGKGSYGYVLYVQPGQLERATAALGI